MNARAAPPAEYAKDSKSSFYAEAKRVYDAARVSP